MNKRFAAATAATMTMLAGQALADTLTVGPNLTDYDYLTITAAVAAAVNGDEIVIAPGLYPENIVINNKDLTLRNTGSSAVTIYGQNLARCLDVLNGSDIVLRGITLTGGRGPAGAGAAININCTLDMEDCIVEGNTATDQGGGLYISGQATLTNVIIRNNTATNAGGGAVTYGAEDSPTTFNNCLFEDNSSVDGGGYAYSKGGSYGALNGCTFRNNHADLRGGAIAVLGRATEGGAIWVRDSLFEDNTADLAGGAVWVSDGDVYRTTNSIYANNVAATVGGVVRNEQIFDAVNCTFAGNDVTAAGVADTFESNRSDAVTSLLNCIVTNDAATSKSGPGQYAVSYSLVPEAASSTPDSNHNINADPMFVSPAGGNYRLQQGSAAIDSGNSLGVLNTVHIVDLPYDFEGNDRNVDDPDTANIGVPAWALNIDMGAIEYQPDAAPECPADLNDDGSLNFFDVQIYLSQFSVGCP